MNGVGRFPIDLSRHAAEVAPELLGCVLIGPNGAGRIVEVEAYGGADDPASHARRGPTERSRPMFETAGTLYVYLIYGMHHCANIVTGPRGDGQAVLIRAVEPVGDVEAMRAARPGLDRAVDLTNGPGKLCQALGIDRRHDGLDLLAADSPVRLETGAPPAPTSVAVGPRVGISVAQDRPWRWYVRGCEWVSRRGPPE